MRIEIVTVILFPIEMNMKIITLIGNLIAIRTNVKTDVIIMTEMEGIIV